MSAAARALPAHLAERDAYRRHVVDTIRATGFTLPDAAAVLVDMLAGTPQGMTADLRHPRLRYHANEWAEDAGLAAFTAESLAAELAVLERRNLLPAWCVLPAEHESEATR